MEKGAVSERASQEISLEDIWKVIYENEMFYSFWTGKMTTRNSLNEFWGIARAADKNANLGIWMWVAVYEDFLYMHGF